MERFSAIIFCIVCCTPQDVTDPKQEEFSCIGCGQEWSAVLDPERFAAHSIA